MPKSKAVKTRQDWRCPSCGRKYRIPVNAKAPSKCPDCAEEEKTIADQESGAVKKELSLSHAPVQQPVVTTTFFEPDETEDQKEKREQRQKKSWKKTAQSNPLVAALLEEEEEATPVTREEIEDILKYMKNISKTMTIVRRMLGMFIIMTILSLLSMIIFAMKAKDMFQGLAPDQLLQQVQPVNVNALPNPNPAGNPQPNQNPGANKTAEDINELFKILKELQEGKL